MSTHSTPFSRFLGCDVSKHTVTFYDSYTKKVHTVANSRSELSNYLQSYGLDCLAICEPTGNHEALLLEVALNRVSIHRTDTMKVKSFIRSYGTLGKTDELDARALALYGEE